MFSHFNIEDRRKQLHFWPTMVYYFKKGKKHNWKAKKARFLQCMDKMLWLIKWVKGGLQSFVLEISHWMMLHGWEDQLNLIAIKSRYWLRKINVIPRETANILKISKSSFENHLHQFSHVNHFDVWVPHKQQKPSWPYFCMQFSTEM